MHVKDSPALFQSLAIPHSSAFVVCGCGILFVCFSLAGRKG